MMSKNDRWRHAERLASCVADEEPLTCIPDDSNPHAAAFLELQSVVRGFRQVQLQVENRPARKPLFRFGQLEVIEKLGEGAQAEVYRAFDPVMDQYFALKLRRPVFGSLSHEFLEEARHLACIHHPNVVRVYGAAIIDDRAGLWTELVHGSTLEDLLAKAPVFSLADVRNIGRKLCEALAALHAQGIVHGDIKPGNVMIDDSGRIVLMDFGAAQKFRCSTPGLITVGTLQFLAPEVIRGAEPSPHSDLYSLGVLLFRLLTGSYPYAANDFDSLCLQQDSSARLKLSKLKPGLPLDLTQAIECALEIDPYARHRGALAFEIALHPPQSGATRSKVPLALSFLLFVALVAAISIWGSRTDYDPIADAQVSLVRESATAGREILKNGSSLNFGDQLAIEFQGKRPVHLYVFDSDGGKNVTVLFPIHGVAPANPLAAGLRHHIPGSIDGQNVDWQVTSEASSEELVVVAALEPQPEIERAITDLASAGDDTLTPAEETRGISGLVPAPDVLAVADFRLREILSHARDLGKSDKVHVWDFRLPHAHSAQ